MARGTKIRNKRGAIFITPGSWEWGTERGRRGSFETFHVFDELFQAGMQEGRRKARKNLSLAEKAESAKEKGIRKPVSEVPPAPHVKRGG